MAHRLALVAGELDVEEALRRVGTAKKFQRWQHYYEIEPFGTKRDNYHAAIVAKMVADASGVTKESGERFTYEDLLLKFEAPELKRRQSVQEQMAMARIIAMAFNAKGKDV